MTANKSKHIATSKKVWRRVFFFFSCVTFFYQKLMGSLLSLTSHLQMLVLIYQKGIYCSNNVLNIWEKGQGRGQQIVSFEDKICGVFNIDMILFCRLAKFHWCKFHLEQFFFVILRKYMCHTLMISLRSSF